MTSIIILFLGTFWEASMDIIGMEHNYYQSRLKLLAEYFDRKDIKLLGNKFWNNSIAWRNKWKNSNPKEGEAFLGSLTLFVPFVDGWHLVKFIWLMHLFVAILLFEPITSYLILDMAILYLFFGIGHEFFGYVLSVKQENRQSKLVSNSPKITSKTIDINSILHKPNRDKSCKSRA